MSLLDPFLLAMAAPQQGGPNPWLQLIPFALILGIFYFVMVLPMRKRQQKVQLWEVCSIGSAVTRKLKWASTPIIFDQDDHPVSIP